MADLSAVIDPKSWQAGTLAYICNCLSNPGRKTSHGETEK